MTRGLRNHRVQHCNHAPAKLGTQINMLLSRKYSGNVIDKIPTLRATALAIGVHSNTAC